MQTTPLVTAVWSDCLSRLRLLIDEETLDTWFMPIKPLAFDGETLVLQVSSQFMCDFIEENFIVQLGAALRDVIGVKAKLRYKALVDSTAPSVEQGSLSLPSKSSIGLSMPSVGFQEAPKSVSSEASQPFNSQLNPGFSFDCFYESHSNRVALTVAKTIAAKPGESPMNPFFVYGSSGVGKTHLCQAIGLKVCELHPKLRVLYVSSHLFEMQFTSAARKGTLPSFIHFYQQIDLLVVDDIQGLVGKTKTQQAFFQVFNHLYMLNKQIVLTSDKSPAELSGMEERIVSRMRGSLTVKLERPDLELRRTILHHRMDQTGVVLGDEVVDYIAQNIKGNVRELEGTLISLITNSMIDGKEIDLKFAERIVRRAVKVEKREITIELVRSLVSKELDIGVEKMLGKNRKREIVVARQLVMYLCKKYTDQSLCAIGEMLGRRNHTTVLHGHRTICNLMEVDADVRAVVERCEHKLLRPA